ncbi:MAG: peptidase M41, partial [Sphingobacteriales bacterium]
VRTKNLLTEKRAQVELLAEKLLDKEVLFQSDVEALIGARPFETHKPLAEDGIEATPDGGISEGVPPFDPGIMNQQPSSK